MKERGSQGEGPSLWKCNEDVTENQVKGEDKKDCYEWPCRTFLSEEKQPSIYMSWKHLSFKINEGTIKLLISALCRNLINKNYFHCNRHF